MVTDFVLLVFVLMFVCILYLTAAPRKSEPADDERTEASRSDLDASDEAAPLSEAHQESSMPLESATVHVEQLGCDLSLTGLELWSRLVTMKMGDKSGAGRLVKVEKKHNPGGSSEEWIRAAIDQWHQDLKGR